jgi:hypothetical protein
MLETAQHQISLMVRWCAVRLEEGLEQGKPEYQDRKL